MRVRSPWLKRWMSRGPEPQGDSAGQPWAGRHFEANDYSSDDGSATPELADALTRFRDGTAREDTVVDAFRDARLLIPLVAHLAESEQDEHGRTIDKKQELSIVTVAGPEGRSVLPVFSRTTTMSAWNDKARPVPASGARVALAAASESTELVVIDPAAETEFVIRRPALWALAQGESWLPSYADPHVREAFERTVSTELAVHGVDLASGDPLARLAGPALVIRLRLAAGLTQSELDAVLARLAQRWAAEDAIATRVDSLAVQIVTG
jgi:hypothetical protein